MHLLVGIFLSLLAALEALNFTGFCFSEHRYLSSDEVILAALQSQSYQAKDFSRESSDEELKKYISDHPDCCKVAAAKYDGIHSEIVNRLIGRAFSWVELIYELKPSLVAGSPKDGNYYQALVRVNACGNETRREIGMRIDRR
jgi:hypothetical protein